MSNEKDLAHADMQRVRFEGIQELSHPGHINGDVPAPASELLEVEFVLGQSTGPAPQMAEQTL